MNANALTNSLAVLIDRINDELKPLECGELRYGERQRDGEWQDRTNEVIHDKRNLITTLTALNRIALKLTAAP